MNREITDHVVAGDTASQLVIKVTDAPGAGGANHEYEIWHGTNKLCTISFQNGPIKENGVNGITQEALLAIVMDRLNSFQAGPFACADNAMALDYAAEALELLQQRTKDRIARGVEGQTKA